MLHGMKNHVGMGLPTDFGLLFTDGKVDELLAELNKRDARQGALWQAIELVASFFIYLPFARSVDQEYLAAESESEAA